jgi:hypothetical protein
MCERLLSQTSCFIGAVLVKLSVPPLKDSGNTVRCSCHAGDRAKVRDGVINLSLITGTAL